MDDLRSTRTIREWHLSTTFLLLHPCFPSTCAFLLCCWSACVPCGNTSPVSSGAVSTHGVPRAFLLDAVVRHGEVLAAVRVGLTDVRHICCIAIELYGFATCIETSLDFDCLLDEACKSPHTDAPIRSRICTGTGALHPGFHPGRLPRDLPEVLAPPHLRRVGCCVAGLQNRGADAMSRVRVIVVRTGHSTAFTRAPGNTPRACARRLQTRHALLMSKHGLHSGRVHALGICAHP